MSELGSRDVIAFIATTNAARARQFYESVLGLTFVAEEPFVLVFDANGTMFRISIVESLPPLPYTVLGWEIPDIAVEVEGLTSKGVVFQRYDQFEQDELGVVIFPSGDRVAWFQDPDGNTLSLTHFA